MLGYSSVMEALTDTIFSHSFLYLAKVVGCLFFNCIDIFSLFVFWVGAIVALLLVGGIFVLSLHLA